MPLKKPNKTSDKIKVLQYFGYVRHNSAALDAFVEIVKRMLTSPDILWMLLIGFASVVGNMALELIVLSLLELLAWSSRFLQPEQSLMNHLVTVQRSTTPLPFIKKKYFLLLPQHFGPVHKNKALISELDYITHLSIQLSNHTQRFYGISTIVGYSKSNLLYTYTLNI